MNLAMPWTILWMGSASERHRYKCNGLSMVGLIPRMTHAMFYSVVYKFTILMLLDDQ